MKDGGERESGKLTNDVPLEVEGVARHS